MEGLGGILAQNNGGDTCVLRLKPASTEGKGERSEVKLYNFGEVKGLHCLLGLS